MWWVYTVYTVELLRGTVQRQKSIRYVGNVRCSDYVEPVREARLLQEGIDATARPCPRNG